jgi:hypothetical protein
VAGPRVFTSFAIEDQNLRNLFVGQARNSSTPFEITDYSVKSAWDNSWKTNCRSRLRGCAALVGIITRNTPSAEGQIWEIKCAIEEGIPVLLMYGSANDRGVRLPSPLSSVTIRDWDWPTLERFVGGLR